MSQEEKALEAIRNNPRNVSFGDLCWAVQRTGFKRAGGKGDHRVYRHPDHPEEMLNLQPRPDGKAKYYQVMQFLDALDRITAEQDL